MDRSRSSKRYYYDNPDYDSENGPRNKPRYGSAGYHHHRPPPQRGVAGGRKLAADPSVSVTTSYRILCHDVKAGGVIGKSGSIIKAIRQHTGAWINVHELIPGDEERIIEISDTRRRDPDGRIPAFSPAQEALSLIHERILESDNGGGNGGAGGGEDGYGRGDKMMVTRLVVARMHVGSLMGKGGKIIEQMRMDTKTHIRILPRDHTIPRCVSMSEEIVQVVGEMNAVKKAISIISSRLRESQHRDRGHFPGRLHSSDIFLPPHDDFSPQMDNGIHRSTMDGANFGSKFSGGRGNNYSSRHYDHAADSEPSAITDSAQLFTGEEIVFRILCPTEKVVSVVGEPDGIIDMLQNEVGVDVKVTDPVLGSNEQIIVVTSDEGPDDDMFPAQEALLHIQTRIVDLEPEKENIVTTRLLMLSDEVGCFDEKRGSLSLIKKIANVDVKILPREELPVCVSDSDEIVQIVGEIKAAREALLEVTSRLRSFFFRGFFKDSLAPFASVSSPMGSDLVSDGASNSKMAPCQEDNIENEPSTSNRPSVVNAATAHPKTPASVKLTNDHVSSNSTVRQNDIERREDVPNGLNSARISMPLVTRSTLEVVIPPHVASKLITKTRNKLAQISELSGASVQLTEDKPDVKEKIIQISGTPEQAERAQSLLQGFILSIEEDCP